MRTIIIAIALTISTAGLPQSGPASQPAPRIYRLQELTWREAEHVLTPETVVLIPVGAATVEHGPHLKLHSDQLIAEHLTARAAASTSVVVAPTLTYHYYPAFLEYPGSTSLSLNSARESTADIVRSLARFGPRRFYVLPSDQLTAAERTPVAHAKLDAGGCSEGDARAVRGIGDAFASHWANADAESLGRLWTVNGDIVHPDASVERTPVIITQNRAELFKRREYRATRHPMQVGPIRCLADGLAVADGKWELRGITDANGKFLPSLRGLFAMVVERSDSTWRIAAYRYTIDPAGPTVPTLLKRPGYPGEVD